MRAEYAYHQPDVAQAATMEQLRQAYSALADAVEQQVPAGRYRSLALTALEQAAFWTNKAIVLRGNRE